MVFLGVVERPGLRDLGRELAIASLFQGLLVLLREALGDLLLLVVVVVDRAAILRADVVALAHALGRVVRLEERLHELRVGHLARVVDHLDDLGMAGLSGADFLVRRVRREAAAIADERRPNAVHLPEKALGAPETTEGEGADLHPFREGRLDPVAVDGVMLRDLERGRVAAGKGRLRGGHLGLLAEELVKNHGVMSPLLRGMAPMNQHYPFYRR